MDELDRYFITVWSFEERKKTRIFMYTQYNMRINDIAQLSINYKME